MFQGVMTYIVKYSTKPFYKLYSVKCRRCSNDNYHRRPRQHPPYCYNFVLCSQHKQRRI